MTLLNNPSLTAYAVACLVLCANLMFLWGYSGAARGTTKTALNEEDAAAFGATLVQTDPPPVARILRAHSNAQASIFPFLFLGLVFVLAGGGATLAAILFGVFTLARLLHTVAYLRGWQPWRTAFFVLGALAMLGLMVSIVWLLAHSA